LGLARPRRLRLWLGKKAGQKCRQRSGGQGGREKPWVVVAGIASNRRLHATNAGHAPLLVANSQRALVGLAQMGVIELHAWNAVAPDLEHPDCIAFDFDPDPALAWKAMIEAAQMLKLVLDELGLVSFPKTSGGNGLHIIVPLTQKQDWDEVKAFSKAVAQHLAKVLPSRFSAVSGPRNRVGKIFVDYLRNSKGARSVAAFSVRARPCMGVSMPVAWEEVKSLKGADRWNMRSAVTRQRRLGGEVWAGRE
jgi:bifunctional non-homologous end joining protein LigD